MNAKNILPLLKETAKEWSDDNAMRLSAALSYYSIFSIAPLLLIIIGIAGKFFANNGDAEQKVLEYLGNVVGSQVATALQGVLQSAKQNSNSATIIGFLTLFLGASTVFGQLKEALNTIWGVRPKPGLGISNFIKQRLLSFGMVLVIGLLLLVSLVMTTAITYLNGWLAEQLGIPQFVTNLIGFVLAFGVETLLFALIFKLLPDAKVEWRSVWIGAAATALLFEIGKFGLSAYLGSGSATSSFGAGAAVVLLLLWIYYASNILFFGAEFTQVYAYASGHAIQPSEIAEFCPEAQPAGMVASPGTQTTSAVPASKPSPAKEALEPESATPVVPPKESLEPLLASAASEFATPPTDALPHRHLLAPPRTRLEEWLARANLHPFAEIGAAVGTGLVVGLLSRMLEHRSAPELSAKEHLRIGTKEAAAAGAAALAALGPKIARQMNSKALKKTAREVKKQMAEAAEGLPKQVHKVFR